MPARETIGYGQFCPIAMASELLCRRWTTLILREMLCGSTQFNDLRRGLPRMSPALLSMRLRELAEAGLIERRGRKGATSYHLTPAGEALRPVIVGMGEWAHRWIESSASLANLDPSLLMWDIRRNLQPEPMPVRRAVVQFLYKNLPAGKDKWWLIVDEGNVDLCYSDPGFDVDLYVATDLRTMTAIWMGFAAIKAEVEARRVFLEGDERLAATVSKWLGYSPFAVKTAS
ncbi:transcriptional regulator [Silicimonas algicola]|uniref:HxlR family transcriptional regulator n=1 Tax=Silicimonas algicola TaxID=1826607 RepID=A0A316GFS1_9RHOB|nr:helix-turn-helix domain-containing protein [Silicimonas algicola]AZQ65935.1 transcriptional regulator [Silicimonas algicola]PWK58220.1 HxlR family transcriptional regulator [Silicimonas algicola]